MLARYTIYRGKRPDGVELPNGVRQDTRKHTRHCLRPPAEAVAVYLACPTPEAWRKFEAEYLECLKARYDADSAPFDELARLATNGDVFLGCSCPTRKNPDVNHCHTMPALRFMRRRYPRLDVRFPPRQSP
ncbi:MAG: hypothetical protein RIC55_00605 [Pirellulaceae bacterium]